MKTQDYSPRFPRAVNGKDWRPALDHPGIEAIARRADCLYRAAMPDDMRGLLIKKYQELEKADRYLARRLRDEPVWITELRPRFWNDALGAECNRDRSETVCGFVWRVLEFIESLERKYPGDRAHDDGCEAT